MAATALASQRRLVGRRIANGGSINIKVSASLLFIVLLATACSTPQTSQVVRFHEQDQANIIVRYYSDETSYVVKPQKTEGGFLSIFRRGDVLDMARKLPDRELAVVILIHYPSQDTADAVRTKWASQLTGLGYQRAVFLGGSNSSQIDGLPILAQVD